jgi:hypothetical protein
MLSFSECAYEPLQYRNAWPIKVKASISDEECLTEIKLFSKDM